MTWGFVEFYSDREAHDPLALLPFFCSANPDSDE